MTGQSGHFTFTLRLRTFWRHHLCCGGSFKRVNIQIKSKVYFHKLYLVTIKP